MRCFDAMNAFRNILVATDFGDASAEALERALALAVPLGARITLLHVYSLPVANYGYAAGLYWPVADLERAAQGELDGALAKIKERYGNVEGLVACGEPCPMILEAARLRNADLIVMGTHGRRGLSRALLGSVAEKVVRLSPVPVLTVSSREDRELKTSLEGATAHG